MNPLRRFKRTDVISSGLYGYIMFSGAYWCPDCDKTQIAVTRPTCCEFHMLDNGELSSMLYRGALLLLTETGLMRGKDATEGIARTLFDGASP